MHLILTLLAVVELLSTWGCLGDVYPPAYEKACGNVSFRDHYGFEAEASVFRTMRERRSLECDCGEGTLLCVIDDEEKFCLCSGNTWVIDLPCEECPCPNGICNGTSKCRCQRGYGLKAENTCEACACDDDMSCEFAEGLKLCLCYEEYVSVNRRCKGCNCGTFEMCFDRQVEKKCSCPGKGGDFAECNTFIHDECDCTRNDFCKYNTSEVVCRCLPFYAKLNGTCTECSCEDKNAACDFQNGEKVCSCKKRFVEHNGTCVECFCGEGHSCELKNGSTACICQEGHIEHEGICHECVCGEGEDCELVDGKKICICKENYVRVDGTCKECFCGAGHECNYIPGSGKLCMCQKFFVEVNGTCEECHCGGGHDCEILHGKKNCLCSPGFSEKSGICVECFCGNNSFCGFDGEDKVCLCSQGTIFKNGMCHDICRNDTCDRGTCEMDVDTFRCSCDIGFGGDRCDQKLAVSKEASYVIYTLIVVTIFWIILAAAYLIKTRRRRNLINYRKVSKINMADDGVYLSTVASCSDR